MADELIYSREVREGRVNIQNVIGAYLIELVEARAYYITSYKTTDTPSDFKSFFIAFNKFFHFCESAVDLSDEVQKKTREEIDEWFKKINMGNPTDRIKGVNLSVDFQRIVEEQDILSLFEETIVPPYLKE
jgi:hypothetical protein